MIIEPELLLIVIAVLFYAIYSWSFNEFAYAIATMCTGLSALIMLTKKFTRFSGG